MSIYIFTLTVTDDLMGTSFHEEIIMVGEEAQVVLNQQGPSLHKSRLWTMGGVVFTLCLVAILLIILRRKRKTIPTIQVK